MIAEMRIKGLPTEPEIIQVTEYELSCRCKMVTATILSTTNYFRLPNDIFNLDLSVGEIAVYAFILRMENRRTYTCFPSYKTIGRALNMSKNTVRDIVEKIISGKINPLPPVAACVAFSEKSSNRTRKRN